MRLTEVTLRAVFVACILTLVRSHAESGDTSSADYPSNGFMDCHKSFTDIKLFEVSPGLGWDNLRNVEASQVVDNTYHLCRTTDAGRYLIPDSVFTVPRKRSHVETLAHVIESWHNASSLTSRSINVNTGLTFGPYSISGSFSRESQQMKARQIQDKTVTVRVMLQYNRYEVKLQPHFPLSQQFITSVKSLAARIELNQTEMAHYESQLIVRDFGTHYLTSVTAGAALVKDDFVKRDYMASQSANTNKILTSASFSYFGIFKFDASIRTSRQIDVTVDRSYKASLTQSTIQAYGGPVIKAQEMTVDQWSDGVDENLVPMDRTGDPLFFLITPQRFPDLPAATVARAAEYVRRAINVYYEMNVIRGCTRQESPEFSAQANFDDGSCTTAPTNITFGGVYQTCTVSGRFLHINPCSGLREVNPKTGGPSCPASYTPVKIYAGSRLGPAESERHCRRCGFLGLRRCCHTTNYQARANYETYWCVATGPVHPESGYRFGGVFTSTSINLVTGSMSCPAHFKIRKMLENVFICISDDFELSAPVSIPFAGFFSCQTGNPLASQTGSLPWPSRCPDGFSQHLASVVMGCAVHYCFQTGALSGPILLPVKRPPFIMKPALPMTLQESFVVFDPETQTWMKGEEAMMMLNETQTASPPSAQKDSNGGSRISSTVFIGIALLNVLFFLC